MKRLGIISEILFAAAVAVCCFGAVWLLGPGIWGPRLMRLLIAGAAAAQCLHYRSAAERRGNLPLLVLALSAVVAPGFILPWAVYFFYAAGVVWCYRSVIRYRSFLPAAADALLAVCSVAAAIFVLALTEGAVIGIWVYMLGQALVPVIPASESKAGSRGSCDRFASAYGDAERALRALAVSR